MLFYLLAQVFRFAEILFLHLGEIFPRRAHPRSRGTPRCRRRLEREGSWCRIEGPGSQGQEVRGSERQM